MVEGTVSLVNPLGLHARAAAKVVNLVKGFESSVLLVDQAGGVSANAGSILELLALSASNGSDLKVVVEGSDEATALAAVIRLFGEGFGEI